MELFGKPRGPRDDAAARRSQLKRFEKAFGLRFRTEGLLDLALSHRSYTHEASGSALSNERLEFLGDSVLGLIVSAYLYRELTGRPEGDLAKIKAFVVSEDILSQVALNLGLDAVLLLGRGEELSGGRAKKALLADALEAVVAAAYLDAGLAETQRAVLAHFVPEITAVLENRHKKDYKTLLQEWVQKAHKTYPRYQQTERSGPDHNRTFTVEVLVNGAVLGRGSGKNKKEAEQAAAGLAYRQLTGVPGGPEGAPAG